jgi:NhaA family Na+:H+ antiporter
VAHAHDSAKRLRKPRLADRLAAPVQRFLAIEAASTILLVLATAVALVWANSRWHESYDHLWHTYAGVSIGDWSFRLSLEHWVNDGLMVLFFFVVGMEIKHELVHGELSSRERAMLPVFGALGGMIAPAAIYLLFHAGGPAASGWGVPMATDIAFAVAALAILGPRVPSGLKVFLLALAIVDDLGAVSVIAAFYTKGLSLAALGAAAAGLVIVYAMNRAGFRAYASYWFVGLLVWAATLASGIHATVAGVLLGFLTPAEPLHSRNTILARARRQADDLLGALEQEGDEPRRTRAVREIEGLSRAALSPLAYLTATLHPLVAFVIMPVFALANAGVRLQADALSDPTALRVAVAVALGLLVGKPVGITALAWLAVRLRIAALPQGVTWASVLGAGVLAGIGFTMALFITALAFESPVLVAASKLGVLGASVLATVLGTIVLLRVLPRPAPPPG